MHSDTQMKKHTFIIHQLNKKGRIIPAVTIFTEKKQINENP